MSVVRRSLLIALLVLMVVPMLALAGSVPHSHDSAVPAIFNAEHDLTLLATSSAAALVDVAPLLFTVVVVATLALLAPERLLAAPHRGAASRAPPAR